MNPIKQSEPSFDGPEYTEFGDFLCKISGIDLGPNKQYLVSTRIRRILHDNNLHSLGELTKRIHFGGDKHLLQAVIDVMTTNETFWFRDKYPFDYLEKIIIDQNLKTILPSKIRIWSAACSSGQEPYSISMIVEELRKKHISLQQYHAEIVATDLSSKVLESARNAKYDKLAIIRGLSSDRVKLHFQQMCNDEWQLNDAIRSRVSFRPLNLKESFFLLGKFDIVFCRNVLIYFSADLKREILLKIHGTLAPGGMLFLGSSESVTGLNDYYEVIHCSPGIAYKAKTVT